MVTTATRDSEFRFSIPMISARYSSLCFSVSHEYILEDFLSKLLLFPSEFSGPFYITAVCLPAHPEMQRNFDTYHALHLYPIRCGADNSQGLSPPDAAFLSQELLTNCSSTSLLPSSKIPQECSIQVRPVSLSLRFLDQKLSLSVICLL